MIIDKVQKINYNNNTNQGEFYYEQEKFTGLSLL